MANSGFLVVADRASCKFCDTIEHLESLPVSLQQGSHASDTHPGGSEGSRGVFESESRSMFVYQVQPICTPATGLLLSSPKLSGALLQVFHTTLTSMATPSPASSNGSLGKLLLHALLTLPQNHASGGLHDSSALALSALQSTLASITGTQSGSTDVAVSVLLDCSDVSSAFYLRRQDLFVRVMARMEHLQDAQVHSLAKLFGRMIVQENAPADEMIDVAAFPFTCSTQQYYDNMLAAADMSKKCIAVIGSLHCIFELAAASPGKAENARAKLEMLVERLQKTPILMSFLLDTFSDMLVSHVHTGRRLSSVCHLVPLSSRLWCIHILQMYNSCIRNLTHVHGMQENPILVQMRDYLGETLLESVLIDELKDGLPEKKSTVSVPGGPVVNVELWMLVTKSMPETCCNLLFRLLSTDASERQYAKVPLPRQPIQ